MKRRILFLSIGIFLSLNFSGLAAENSAKKETKEEPRRNMFVYETNEEDAKESLNRVAGHYDLGFSSPDQSFKSEDHYMPSPFARERFGEDSSDSPSEKLE